MLGINKTHTRGTVTARVIKNKRRAPLGWRIKNAARWGFIKGVLAKHIITPLASAFGLLSAIAELSVVVKRADGSRVDYGTVCYRVITDAGVAYLVDAWQNSVELENMKYHGCGTGATAEDASDTALGTESTTALDPDSTRATGTLAEGATANIFSSVGTLSFDAGAAVTEHGLFSQAATGGGTLFDRSVFSAINVEDGDSIQFTYQVTFTSGG